MTNKDKDKLEHAFGIIHSITAENNCATITVGAINYHLTQIKKSLFKNSKVSSSTDKIDSSI